MFRFTVTLFLLIVVDHKGVSHEHIFRSFWDRDHSYKMIQAIKKLATSSSTDPSILDADDEQDLDSEPSTESNSNWTDYFPPNSKLFKIKYTFFKKNY